MQQMMMIKKVFLAKFLPVLILLMTRSSRVVSEITTAPSNRTALVGQSVVLHCCSNEARPIDWFYTRESQLSDSEYESRCAPGASNQCIQITSDGVLIEGQNNRFNVFDYNSPYSSCSSLSFEVHNMSYAGAYRCRAGFESKANAFLTVIDRRPTCSKLSSAMKTEAIQLLCGFSYSGRTPELRWWTLNSSSDIMTKCSNERNFHVIFAMQISAFYENISCFLGQYDRTELNHVDFTDFVMFDSRNNFFTTLRCSYDLIEYRTRSTVTDVVKRSDDDCNSCKTTSAVLGATVALLLTLLFIVLFLFLASKRKNPGEKSVPAQVTFERRTSEVLASYEIQESPKYENVCSSQETAADGPEYEGLTTGPRNNQQSPSAYELLHVDRQYANQ